MFIWVFGTMYVVYVGLGGTLLSCGVSLPSWMTATIDVLSFEGGVIAALVFFGPLIFLSNFFAVVPAWVGIVLIVARSICYVGFGVFNVALVSRLLTYLSSRRAQRPLT